MSVAIDPARQQRARRYAIERRVLGIAELVVGALYLGALVSGGRAIGLRDAVASTPFGRFGLVAAYFLALWLGYTVLTFAFSVVSGWWLPRRYGLGVQTFGQWLGDWAKAQGIGIVMGLLAVESVYALLLAVPDLWWLIAGTLFFFLVVGLANLGPILLLPLFFKLTPLEPGPLTERLEDLATRAGARVRGVFRMNLSAKTTAANAALMGLGNTRRIVLGDTLLDRYSTNEIEVIFAHELGHHVHRDVPRLVAIQSVVTLAGLYLANLALVWAAGSAGDREIADVATMPMLALMLGAFEVVAGPFQNYLSRRAERAADEYALQATDDPSAFVTAMTRLANQNLSELDPPRWIEVLFYDHPALGRRIRQAECYGRRGVA